MDVFLETYYAYNKPVIIRNKLYDKCKKITIDYLYKNYDNFEIEIQKGRTKTKNYEVISHTLKIRLDFRLY